MKIARASSGMTASPSFERTAMVAVVAVTLQALLATAQLRPKLGCGQGQRSEQRKWSMIESNRRAVIGSGALGAGALGAAMLAAFAGKAEAASMTAGEK